MADCPKLALLLPLQDLRDQDLVEVPVMRDIGHDPGVEAEAERQLKQDLQFVV